MNRATCSAATILLMMAPGAAFAASDGFYVGLGAGLNSVEDSDIDGSGAGAANELEAEDNWMAAVTAGYAWQNGLRTELELATRTNDIDSISPLANGSGEYNAGSLMANLLYDFKLESGLTPYVGIGAGLARIHPDGAKSAAGMLTDDDDNVFAAQAIAGVSYDLSDQWQMFADYRYLVADDPQFEAAAGGDIDMEYASHTVMLGLRYYFNAPEPAPAPEPVAQATPQPPATPAPAAPEPAPEVVRSFLVFFGFDEATLTPEARDIVEAAAGNVDRAAITQITVTGHTDRAGPDSYNQRLSTRRAEAVKDELVRLGVPEDAISIRARGEADPLVPTGDGVREPQNRRVEIVLD